MNPNCPDCRRPIPLDDVNVGRDIALCRQCGKPHAYSDLLEAARLHAAADKRNPPDGTWQRADGSGTVIGATHRSWGSALGALGFAAFWNGIVSIFVSIAVTETLQRWGVDPPEWFPAPKMDGDGPPFGSLIFLWLFLTPFILVGSGMLWAVVNYVGGKTEVRIRNGEGTVFTGLGPLGWRRRFDAQSVKAVRVEVDGGQQPSGKGSIVVETHNGRRIKFGTWMREDRKAFVAGALLATLR
jgi:hypothetical protein